MVGAPGDEFGFSVAVSGSTAVVGAYGTNSHGGAAYIYVRGASGWRKKPTATLSDPGPGREARGDVFGISVAVSGTAVVVGSAFARRHKGATYIYVRAANVWPTTPTVKLLDPAATGDDQFGLAVAVSGRTALIGAEGTNSSAGAAYLYEA